MADPLYALDRAALQEAVARRGFDAPTLAKLAHLELSTVRRCLGETYPKSMSSARRNVVRAQTVRRLAEVLRVPPRVLCPSLPEPQPKPKPPEPAPQEPRRSELPPWKSRADKATVYRR
jgi:hypothetical protein